MSPAARERYHFIQAAKPQYEMKSLYRIMATESSGLVLVIIVWKKLALHEDYIETDSEFQLRTGLTPSPC